MSSDRTPVPALTPKAETDLEDIWRYTAESWSIRQADTYIRELVAAFRLIASMPLMARERTEFTPPVRIHIHERHLIVYVAQGRSVEILRILGGRQDWISILNDAEP